MYNSYFGFRESPFSVTPDPRFFYTNSAYLEAFATLRYGIEAKKGFIVITGEVGTGKTTLLRKLLHTLADTVHSVFIFNSCLSFPELLQVTLQDLGLTPPTDRNKVQMLQELNDYLIKQLNLGHTVTMLIDEAQNLSDEVLENLRLLSNLETDQEKLIQIVLMGQPELHAKLGQLHLRQLKQRIALQCRLNPLADTEVGRYIHSRLVTAGYEGNSLFDPEAIERIAMYANGIPRVTNIICDNALLSAYAASQQIISADMIETVARDLELRSEPSVETLDASVGLVPKIQQGTALVPLDDTFRRRSAVYAIRAGVGALLVMFAFVAVAAVVDFRKLGGVAGRGFGSLRHSLDRWGVAVNHSAAAPERRQTKDAAKRQYERVIIQPGSTVQKIAADTYGPNTILGMDLIKEFNPQIQNLNRVLPGQDLLLPPLSPETLLREQADGSYQFIVASFSNRPDALAYIRVLSNEGYQVAITPSKVADDLSLQRVQIVGLKNLKEAMQTWDKGLNEEWFTFLGRSNGGDQLSKADMAY
ncbi:MAG TPA: AAA family ATPase [Candidatus Binatia bacterium]|jgi:general secretion pathway protein A